MTVSTGDEIQPASRRWGRRHARVAVAASGAIAVALLLAGLPGQPAPKAVLQAAWSPATECPHGVDIFTSVTDRTSPFRFGTELGNQLATKGWQTNVIKTNGSSENLYYLERRPSQQHPVDDTRCGIAISLLTVATDAVYGAYQFDAHGDLPSRQDPDNSGQQLPKNQILGLRAVAPGYDELVQLFVRPHEYTEAGQLCGRKVATSDDMSGTKQIAQTLFNVACQGSSKADFVEKKTVKEQFNLLATGDVDAVLTEGISPADTILDMVGQQPVRLIDVSRYLNSMIDNWKSFYRQAAGGEAVEGRLFSLGRIYLDDYNVPAAGDDTGNADDNPGIGTVATPNGLFARETTSDRLVADIATIMTSEPARTAVTNRVWERNHNPEKRHLIELGQIMTIRAPYCYVPFHPAAAPAIEKAAGGLPDCVPGE